MYYDAKKYEHPSPISEWYASSVISRQQKKLHPNIYIICAQLIFYHNILHNIWLLKNGYIMDI